MSSFPIIYQLIHFLKNGTIGTRTLKKHWDDVAESGTSGFSSIITPLKVVSKIILLISGHAFPLFNVDLWMFIMSLLNNWHRKPILFIHLKYPVHSPSVRAQAMSQPLPLSFSPDHRSA